MTAPKFKNETITEAFEELEGAVIDLVYFKVDPVAIRKAVEREIASATERREDAAK